MTRIRMHVLILLSYLAVLIAATAPSFCKCTCFTNSTIITLKPQHGDPGQPEPPDPCSRCNRKFCMGYNLPICKDAEEKDVTSSCFKRDSPKDQIIVWSFILGTAALLGWAGVNKVMELRRVKTAGEGLFGALGGDRSAGQGRGDGVFGRTQPGVAYSPLEEPTNGGERGTG